MARLNEPPVSTDCVETLRRKFLRQNRELARVNSIQSHRIRELEGECARLLSENLELRGKVLHLEQEAEESAPRRIADHALEIKTQMEKQLTELSSILAGLGLEPPRKRLSPPGRKIANAKSSPGRSPAARRPRNVAKEAEAMAMQQGRLPSIEEHKPYPTTKLIIEIKPAQSETLDATDSPDLGPPPTSRYVSEDPVKFESPSKRVQDVLSKIKMSGKVVSTESALPAPRLDFNKRPIPDDHRKNSSEDCASTNPAMAEKERTGTVAAQTLKTGAKRKFGDENIKAKIGKDSGGKPAPSDIAMAKQRPIQDLQKRKSFKDLSASAKERKDTSTGSGIASANPRKVLAAKSTNETCPSPRKPAKASNMNDLKPTKPQLVLLQNPKERPSQKGTSNSRDMSETQVQEPTSKIDPQPLVLSPDPRSAEPDTPDRPAGRDFARDTPPPGDISSMGEISRPSRRARTAISYAEPNLRDKMRRPTKELFDAVAGEGKYIQRTGQAKPDEQHGPASASKEGFTVISANNGSCVPVSKTLIQNESVVSPLALKNASTDALPSTIVTDRKRRASSAGSCASLAASDRMDTVKHTMSSRDDRTRRTDPDALSHQNNMLDIYDFNSSSPVAETRDRDMDVSANSVVRRASMKPRRSSSVLKGDSSDAAPPLVAKSSKISSGSKKRASMAAPRKGSIFDSDDDYEAPRQADDVVVPSDRVSRRRSMML